MPEFKLISVKTLLILVLLTSCLPLGCKPTNPAQQPTESKSAGSVLKGVGLSPKSNASDDFTEFFEKAKEAGKVVMWAGDWMELAKIPSGPLIVTELAPKYNYIPLIEVQFFTQATGKLLRPLNEATRQSYINMSLAFAQKYKPGYLGVGIEVNVLFEKSPSDFDIFVQLYADVYNAVKAVSPDTKVFTVFQLEKMAGLNGGLFGGTNDLSQAQWSLLNKFPQSDMIAFTTYPGLIYKTPADIPADYYTSIIRYTDKPLAFTEIGWHSEASPVGWESSPAEQAEFVSVFFRLTQELNEELAVWSFVYDQDIIAPFNSMGLRYKDGSDKIAWNKWLEATG